MISLQNVTVENFWEVIGLQVSDEQKDLVVLNVVSIAQAHRIAIFKEN
jgi:diamine N-acetyltransferase